MKRPNWKYLFFLAVNMLSAFFLTKLIDDVTLVTNMQRIFVFLYFMTGSGAVSWIWMKKWKRVLWKQLIFSVVIAACFMIAAVPRLFYKNAKIQISPAESSNNNSLGSEIWLKEIRVDGNVHAVSQYENRKGWYIEDSSGSLVSYGEDFTQPVNMEVRYQDQVQLLFIAHKWSGKVKVETRNDSFVYDLYSKQGTDVIKTFDYDELGGQADFGFLHLLTLCSGWVFFFQWIYMLCCMAWAYGMEIWAVYVLGICGLWINGLCSIGTLAAAVVCGTVLHKISKLKLRQAVGFQKRYLAAIAGISIYTTFALIARETFLYQEKHLLAVLFLSSSCFCMFMELLAVLERLPVLRGTDDGKRREPQRLKTGDKVFLVSKNILLALFAATMAVLFLDVYIIKEYQDCEIEIVALAEHGNVSQSNEVLLDSVRINGKKTGVSQYVVSADGGFKKFGEDSYIYNHSEQKSRLKLAFTKTRKIELYFYNYAQAGKACIRDAGQEFEIDFSSLDESYSNNFYVYEVRGNTKQMNYAPRYAGYTFFVFLIILLLTASPDYYLYRHYGRRLKMEQRYVFWSCFFILIFGLNIVCVAYFPGNWTWDNLFQWAQATDMVALSNGHPVIMTLFLKILLTIYKHPVMLLESVILLGSVTFSSIYTYLFENGMKRRTLYMLSVLTVLSPSVLILTVTLLKDSFHMYFMALTVFYCYIACRTPDYFRRPYYLIGLAVSLFFIRQLRHEAVVSFIACSMVFFAFGLAKRNYYILGAVVLSIMVSFGFDQYKDSLLEEEPSVQNTGITLLLNDMSRVLYDGKSLTKETEKLMQKYMPLENWKTYYNPYDRDAIGFHPEYEQAMERNKDISLSEVLTCYSKEFVCHPGSMIRARLDAVNCMWSLSENQDAEIFYGIDGIMTFYCVGPKELGFKADENGTYTTNNLVSKIVKPVLKQMKENQVLQVVFLNVGTSIVCFLVLLFFLWEKDKKMMVVLLPAAVRIGTMLLTAGWQHFRYYYSIRLMVSVSVLLIIYDRTCSQKANGIKVDKT
ncbi:MAG: hypothetical protein HFH35_11285 [Eubacterium sp.]|nr:hypothetical protein [Eubacterium sp.]